MTATQIIFYIIAAFILGSGLLSVISKNIFRSAIWLLFSLLGIAALYFWLQVEFVAAVQIALYVGGIVVLIIFSIFLTQQSGKEMPEVPLKRTLAAVLAVVFGFAFTYFLIYQYQFKAGDASLNGAVRQGIFDTDVERIGNLMLSTGEHGFALPFEVISILLLAAMIGCIVIAAPSRPSPNEKASNTQKPTDLKNPNEIGINKIDE